MSKQNVSFIPSSKDAEIFLPYPKPAIKYLPKWYKDMPPYLATLDNSDVTGTGKLCMPFLDSFTNGYIQELPCDLEISNYGLDENGNDIINYKWAGPIRPCSTRLEDQNARKVLPSFNDYYETEFHWISIWEPKTPVGYSAMYHHPSNRFDLPFQTLTGIIDTDKWSIHGPVPFLIKKGFTGIIPAGTPIYQITFIKRENWISKPEEYDENFQKKHSYNIKKIFQGGYKKFYWSKKEYN